MGIMPYLQQQNPDKGATDTRLTNFPLFCPKCKRETIISLNGQTGLTIKIKQEEVSQNEKH